MPASSDQRPAIFLIVGAGRSGTTLLQKMLSQDETVALPTELFFFNSIVPRLTRKFGRAPDVVQISEILDDIGKCWWLKSVDFNPEAVNAFLGVRSTFTWAELYVALLCSFGSSAGCNAVGEKTLSNASFLDEIWEADSSVRVVIVIRDPRACLASRMRSKVGVSNIVPVCVEWRRISALAEKGVDDRRLLTVRYEDLVLHPAETLRHVASFVGGRFDSSMLDFHKREDRGFSLEQRHHANTLRPLFTDSVDAWKGELSSSQVRFVEFNLGEKMRQWGYALVENGAQPSSVFVFGQYCRLPVSKVRSFLRQRFKFLSAKLRNVSS